MKKLFAILVFVCSLLSSLTANAQDYVDPQVAYNHCKMYVKQGNEAYKNGMFDTAQTNYEQALDCNMSCPDKKYMSDKKIQKKINDCIYAINHGGKTRQEANTEKFMAVLDAVAAVGVVAGAVATVATADNGPHHDGPHHDHHDFHHDGYHYDHHDFHHDDYHHDHDFHFHR